MSLNATNLYIQAAPLPVTFRGTPNDFFAEMIKRMKILSPSGTNFIFIGDTEPSSNVGPWLKEGKEWYVWDAATKHYVPVDITSSYTPAFSMGNSPPPTTDPPVWLRTTKDATSVNPLDFGDMIRFYVWNPTVSLWLSPHPVPASQSEVRIWKGTELALWAYDGGDGTNPAFTAPTDYTGAMWEVDADFAFRMPIGAGTNSVTYDSNPATVIAPGATGGEERHVLTVDELGAHNHSYSTYVANPAGPVDSIAAGTAQKYDYQVTGDAGAGESHENLPPFRGVYFIKRTARKYYTP